MFALFVLLIAKSITTKIEILNTLIRTFKRLKINNARNIIEEKVY